MIDLSVILPCYLEAGRAQQSVAAISRSLSNADYAWEIVVVDDGGRDFVDARWPDDPRVSLIRLPDNRGKGAAVRHGILTARGAVRIFTDVDLPFGVGLFPLMMEYILAHGFHLVIGDRTMRRSTYHLDISPLRRAASRVFSTFVGRLVTGGYYDTQCGLKAVRGDIADALFPLLQVDRFAFDVELIYLALKTKADIKRIPVILETNDTSSVRLLRDACQSAWDVLGIKGRQVGGQYSSNSLISILEADIQQVASRAAAHWGVPRTDGP